MFNFLSMISADMENFLGVRVRKGLKGLERVYLWILKRSEGSNANTNYIIYICHCFVAVLAQFTHFQG